jgi:hypothetical protein
MLKPVTEPREGRTNRQMKANVPTSLKNLTFSTPPRYVMHEKHCSQQHNWHLNTILCRSGVILKILAVINHISFEVYVSEE